MTDHSRCHDCNVEPGQPHTPGCDVARCMWTGHQDIACDGWIGPIVKQLIDDGHPEMAERLAHYLSIDASDHEHDCGEDTWTGEFPGVADCHRLGLLKDDGEPDLNRLYGFGPARWDRETKQWELRTGNWGPVQAGEADRTDPPNPSTPDPQEMT